ncbi:MAG: hypothetical protein CSA20_04320 [Deltaproteobacteria bacterium]|nr:MAG: hypothetical protein CSA20_04320 [Deltaproteobacteria bacterium]
MGYKIFTSVCLFLCLLSSDPVLAHKIRIFAWTEGEIIHTESKFSGGRTAKKARIQVYSQADKTLLLTGTTNENGLFDFTRPAHSGGLNITVDAGDGHKNSWYLEDQQPSDGREKMPSSLKQRSGTLKGVDRAASGATAAPQSPGREEIAAIVDKQLEKQLAPIRRLLAEQQERSPGIREILGGIGYILGLAGIAAYMKSKKR